MDFFIRIEGVPDPASDMEAWRISAPYNPRAGFDLDRVVDYVAASLRRHLERALDKKSNRHDFFADVHNRVCGCEACRAAGLAGGGRAEVEPDIRHCPVCGSRQPCSVSGTVRIHGGDKWCPGSHQVGVPIPKYADDGLHAGDRVIVIHPGCYRYGAEGVVVQGHGRTITGAVEIVVRLDDERSERKYLARDLERRGPSRRALAAEQPPHLLGDDADTPIVVPR